jgi:hypothetical protein
MATALAAGGAALTRQYYTDGFYPTGISNPSNSIIPSAALLKATMIASAIPDIVIETPTDYTSFSASSHIDPYGVKQ